MTFKPFEEFDVASWVEDGVLLGRVSAQHHNKLARRDGSWPVALQAVGLSLLMLSGLPVSTPHAADPPTISDVPLVTHSTRFAARDDPDYAPPGYWARLQQHLARLPEVEDVDLDIEPLI